MVVAWMLLVTPAAGAQQPGDTGEADPIAVALAYSSTLPDGGAREVILATSETFADSLASGLLQGQRGAPLLLTPGDALDERVVAEIERLGAEAVIILGGVAALSEEVERQVREMVARVDRVAGDTRIATAMAVADFAYSGGDAPWPCPRGASCDSVIIARAFGTPDGDQSQAFADALGAGAASATRGYPVLLTPTEALDPTVAQWMTDRGVTRVIIAGGPAAISSQVEAELSAMGLRALLRKGGPTRVGTAAEIGGVTAAAGTTTVVPGEGPLAWASGLAAARDSPGGVLLVTGETVPAVTLGGVFGVGDQMRCGVGVSADACRLLTTSAAVDTRVSPYAALLDPDQVVPPTDATSSGTASIWRSGDEALCADVGGWRLSGQLVTAQLRRAAFGENGPVAVSFGFAPNEFGPGAIACTMDIDSQVMQAFTDAPQAHYLDVRTDAYPASEIRGQVFTDQPTLPVRSAPTPDEVVPGPGDPAATGFLEVVPTGVADELCYGMYVESLGPEMERRPLDPPATAVHIHRGEFGGVGEMVFSLDVGVGTGYSFHCDRGLDAEQLEALHADPRRFYVDVHNDAYPDGVMRGQMHHAHVQ